MMDKLTRHYGPKAAPVVTIRYSNDIGWFTLEEDPFRTRPWDTGRSIVAQDAISGTWWDAATKAVDHAIFARRTLELDVPQGRMQDILDYIASAEDEVAEYEAERDFWTPAFV